MKLTMQNSQSFISVYLGRTSFLPILFPLFFVLFWVKRLIIFVQSVDEDE
jgi:hypothetical protein